MKKFLLGLILSASIILASTITAETKEMVKQIPISNIEIIQGFVSCIDDEYIYIDTVDANGWVLEVTDNETEQTQFVIDGELNIDDAIVIVYDNIGTDDIYDDEIIKIVKIQ